MAAGSVAGFHEPALLTMSAGRARRSSSEVTPIRWVNMAPSLAGLVEC